MIGQLQALKMNKSVFLRTLDLIVAGKSLLESAAGPGGVIIKIRADVVF